MPTGQPSLYAKMLPVITNLWQIRITVLSERNSSQAISSSLFINRNLCQTTLQRRSTEYAAGIDIPLNAIRAQQAFKIIFFFVVVYFNSKTN